MVVVVGKKGRAVEGSCVISILAIMTTNSDENGKKWDNKYKHGLTEMMEQRRAVNKGQYCAKGKACSNQGSVSLSHDRYGGLYIDLIGVDGNASVDIWSDTRPGSAKATISQNRLVYYRQVAKRVCSGADVRCLRSTDRDA